MKQVFKFPLRDSPGNAQTVVMPKGAEILCVQNQSEIVNLWALVDGRVVEDRRFVVVNTGQLIDFRIKGYIGTVQLDGGEYVLHIFEIWGDRDAV